MVAKINKNLIKKNFAIKAIWSQEENNLRSLEIPAADSLQSESEIILPSQTNDKFN